MTVTRGVVAALIACLLLAVAAGRAAEAAPRPSSTVVLNCSRDITYTYWPTQAPAIEVFYYTSTGNVPSETSDFLYCNNGGGRERFKINLLQKYPRISVACYRYTGNLHLPGGTDNGWQLDETDFLPLPASGTCSDNGTSPAPNLGPDFASWSVR